MLDIVILLTGCINPNGMPNTKLQNVSTRQDQYVAAIKYYLKKVRCKIVFAENSGNDLSSIFEKEIKSGRLEVITFSGNKYDQKLGKGYGECEIIEYAIKKSEFISNTCFILKITGRLKLLNISSYINYYRKNSNIDALVEIPRNSNYVDSRFFGASLEFLNFFLSYKYLISDKKFSNFEDVLKIAIDDFSKKPYKIVKSAIHVPRFSGISGTNDVAYNIPLMKWYVKNLKRRISNLHL